MVPAEDRVGESQTRMLNAVISFVFFLAWKCGAAVMGGGEVGTSVWMEMWERDIVISLEGTWQCIHLGKIWLPPLLYEGASSLASQWAYFVGNTQSTLLPAFPSSLRGIGLLEFRVMENH